MGQIIWLASYPKSGNTWFRVFLTNLLGDRDVPARINDLHGTSHAGSRDHFDAVLGIEASDLTPDEIDRLRPEVYADMAVQSREPLFMKVHDTFGKAGDTPLFPGNVTRGAVYIIRNPLDVAVSFAHHNGTNYDDSIRSMAQQDYTLCGGTGMLHRQLRQKLDTWSRHVESWTGQAVFPVCVLRYEDMCRTPLASFSQAVAFMGLPHTRRQVETAIAFSRFEELQRQETEEGFREKHCRSGLFFRKGAAGAWQTELNKTQVRRIKTDHGRIMARFGYL